MPAAVVVAGQVLPATAAAAGPVDSPEYDAVDPTDVIGGISGGVTGDMVAPHIKAAVAQYLNEDDFPFLGSTYGAVIPGRVAGMAVAQVGGFVGSVVTDALRGVMHGNVGGVGEAAPGLGWSPTPPNKLLAGLARSIGTSWLDIWLRQALAPAPTPAPAPAPAPAPPAPAPVPLPAPPKDAPPAPPKDAPPAPPKDAPPAPPKDAPPAPPKDGAPAPTSAPEEAPAPATVLGKPIAPIVHDATMGLLRTAIGAAYDQVAGPLVQRVANVVTGRGDEEIVPPKPLTPGKLAKQFVGDVALSTLMRSVEYKPLKPGGTTPWIGGFGASMTNAIVGAALDTVYSRGVGPAIENAVNGVAGLRTKEEQDKQLLPPLEHFLRAALRGVAVGGTYFLMDGALQATMLGLGMNMGGTGGALVAMAGAALLGSIGATVVDGTIGPMLGKLGGSVYSWISGDKSYEQRMAEPSPTPGDPVDAPNGNPGTAPAPGAAGAGIAPAPAAAAAPEDDPRKRKRRPTGDAAVDRTAPAATVSAARLAEIAAAG